MRTRKWGVYLITLSLLLMFLVPANASYATSITYELLIPLPVYMNVYDAKNAINPVTTYPAETYYIYRTYNGMINVSKSQTSPGGWIDPAKTLGSSEPASLKVQATRLFNVITSP